MGSTQGPQKSGALSSSDLPDAGDASRQGKKWRDPPGSTWFKATLNGKRPLEQMLEHAKQHDHKFKAAFNYRPHDNVVKMFASYPTWEDFVSNTLLKANTENRHFYEVIPETEPCKLYLDVEWKGPADPEGIVLHHLVEKLLIYVKVRYFFHTVAQKVLKRKFFIICSCKILFIIRTKLWRCI
jgi:hypothetical protein